MKTKYIDLIEQTFDFPQEEFQLNKKHQLEFHGIDLMELVKTYGGPFKFTYLPKVSENIQKAKKMVWHSHKRTPIQRELQLLLLYKKLSL